MIIIDFIRTTFKIFIRDKFYSLLNIIGLAVGIASAILILLYIEDELTYDCHHINKEQIYRIASNYHLNDNSGKVAHSSLGLAEKINSEIPNVKAVARFIDGGKNFFQYKTKRLFTEKSYYADSTVFQIFTHKLIYGNSNKALSLPNTIVISQSIAKDFFGEENPIGKIIKRFGNQEFVVSGVFEDLPGNSHLKFDCLISIETIKEWISKNKQMWSLNCFTYVLLKNKIDTELLNEKFNTIIEKHIKPNSSKNSSFQFIIQPLSYIHLHSKLEWDLPVGDISYLYIFSAIAFFILLIAAINYINLATARASKRTKEVAMRKVVGASRWNIMWHFLLESLLLVLVALFLAITIAETALPEFNILTSKNLSLDFITSPRTLILLFSITIFTGILAGFYPAFYLSAFQPADIFHKRRFIQRKGGLLRKILVVFQFSISTFMITGTMVVSSQLEFMQKKDLGIDSENIYLIVFRDVEKETIKNLKSELEKHSTIEGIASSSSIILSDRTSRNLCYIENNNNNFNKYALNIFAADYNFIKLLNIKILDGEINSRDENCILVNKATIDYLKLEESLINKQIHFSDIEGGLVKYKINGITENFNYSSLHNEIAPLILLINKNTYPLLNLKFKEGKEQQAINYIKQLERKYQLKTPLKVEKLSQQISDFYNTEQKLSKIFKYFSWFAIFVSCLGLLGLTAYIAEQRTKEIGIRKVVGASIFQIIYMLASEYFKTILIAIFISFPATYIILNYWLNNFAYHIILDLDIFIFSSLIAVFIALFTILYQVVKIALSNPVKALRYE